MKTLKIMILVIIFTTINLGVSAQSAKKEYKGTINGMLVDSEDGLPVGFSNVVLYSSKDSIMITWTITDDKGVFHLESIPDGTYKLVINFIGYKKLKIDNISINGSNQAVDLGPIKLVKDAVSLSEVKVVSYKNAYEVKSDKKVVNVSNDINSAGGTAVDVLRNIPGLTVDADGAVNLRGSDNLSILVDGRPTSIDAKRLDQLSSSDIESIEVITNPSVKYNPEGKSGIINFKLKHKKETGFNGNVNLSAGTGNKYTGSAGINFNTGKFDIFAGYDGISKVVNSSRYLFRESYLSDSPHYLQQDATTKLILGSDKFRFGANIYLNPKNSLTFSISINPSKKTDADHTLSQYFDLQKNLLDKVLTINSETSNENSHDYIAGYKKAFDKKGEELSVDYIFTNSSAGQIQAPTYYYTDSTVKNDIRINTKNYNSNLQINWNFPFNSNTKLESGIQSILRGTESDYRLFNNHSGIMVEDLSQKNNFSYYEQIHSGFSLLTTKYSKMSISAGLRIEQSFIKGKQEVNKDRITQEYFNLYPSFNLMYQATDKSRFLLSYSRRINRPTGRLINPYADRSNPEVLRSGNPLLKPEYVNSFEAGYSGSNTSSVFGLTAYYKHITNVINSLTVLDSTGISHIFPENVASADNYGVESTFEHSFAKWWRINGNASFYRTIIKAGDDKNSNSNYSYNARLNSNFTLPAKITLQVIGNYSGPVIGLYSKIDPQYGVDVALKKDFLKDKFSLTLRATDIFNTLRNGYTAWGYNFNADNWRKQETRVVYLSISYNFGSGKIFKSSKPEIRETGPALEIY